MKKTLLILAALILCTTIWAQVPQGISHQAVIRNTQGELVTGQTIGVRVSILQGSAGGVAVFVETHQPVSNENGLITYVIGQGSPALGYLDEIDWTTGPYFLKTEADPAGGSNYTITGTTQFLSVPYALHAGTSGDNHWEQSGNNIFSRNTGNLGIGITNPIDKLQVDGNARFGNQYAGFLGLGSDFYGGEIGLFDITGDKIIAGKLYTGEESGTYVFGDNLFIRSGNVGIGLLFPEAQLHTTGSVRFEGAGTPGVGKVLTSNAFGTATWQEVPNSSNWTVSGADIYRLEGNLGIGTSIPIEKLHVAGNALFSNDIGIGYGFIDDEIGLTDLFNERLIAGRPDAENGNLYQYGGAPGSVEGLFVNDGNIGLGTRLPNARLDIRSAEIPLLLQKNSNTVGDKTGLLFKVSIGGSFQSYKAGIFFERKYSPGVGNLHFATNNSSSLQNATIEDSRMTITSAGNVGIGTTEPSEKLDINGQIRIRGGNPGQNKVLMSDEHGVSHWESNVSVVFSGLGSILSCIDIDGNAYPTIIFGNQVWMAENLRVTTYNDGSYIPNVVNSSTWQGLTIGGRCWYNNNPDDYSKFGALYNWYAVNDARGLCPEGWRVPTDAEWTAFIDMLGGSSVAAGKLKAVSSLWNYPNVDATNSTGFSALPGGFRNSGGTYYGLDGSGRWWSSTEDSTTDAWCRSLHSGNGNVYRYSSNKGAGFSVRCVRDL